VFTGARQRSLSWARRLQSTLSNPLSLNIYFKIILASTCRSSKWSVFSGFRWKLLYELCVSLMRATCPILVVPLDLITVIIFIVVAIRNAWSNLPLLYEFLLHGACLSTGTASPLPFRRVSWIGFVDCCMNCTPWDRGHVPRQTHSCLSGKCEEEEEGELLCFGIEIRYVTAVVVLLVVNRRNCNAY
jgi:hypothetical protein